MVPIRSEVSCNGLPRIGTLTELPAHTAGHTSPEPDVLEIPRVACGQGRRALTSPAKIRLIRDSSL